MFNISSARSLSYDLLMLRYPKEPDALTVSRTERILKSLKKKNFLQYFVTKELWQDESEEAEYLYNKFPSVKEHIPNNSEVFFVIRL